LGKTIHKLAGCNCLYGGGVGAKKEEFPAGVTKERKLKLQKYESL